MAGVMAGVTMPFNLSSGFCLMVRYPRTVKMVCIQVSWFERIKNLLRFKIYCSFLKDIRYIATYVFLIFLKKKYYILK